MQLGSPYQPKERALGAAGLPVRARVCAMVLHFQYGSRAAAVRAGIEVEAKESKGNILFAFSHCSNLFPNWHHPFRGEEVFIFTALNFHGLFQFTLCQYLNCKIPWIVVVHLSLYFIYSQANRTRTKRGTEPTRENPCFKIASRHCKG
jgi:hypothetical protein